MVERQVKYYQEISLAVPDDQVDAVTDYVIDNIAGGLVLEEEDGSPETIIKFYIPEDNDISGKLNGLKKYLAAIYPAYISIPVNQKNIKNLDWEEAYRKSVTPVEVGESIVVRPPWLETKHPRKTEIILEPKMAFGTGRHESTQGTLIELEKIDLRGKRLLDLGCGSGILGIYAARKGAAEVLGYDIDPLAIENCRGNFMLNGVEGVCRSELGSIGNVPVDRLFDVVMANIIKSVIVPIIGPLAGFTKSGGRMILSGFLGQDKEEMNAALEQHKLKNFSARNDNNWLTYTVAVP